MSQEAARPMMFSQWFSGSFAPLGRLKKPQCSSSVRPRSSEAAQRQTMSTAQHGDQHMQRQRQRRTQRTGQRGGGKQSVGEALLKPCEELLERLQ